MSLEDKFKLCAAALKNAIELTALKNSPMLPGKRRLDSAASLEKYASCCHEDTPAAEENRPPAV
jgi:hypothetical protein